MILNTGKKYKVICDSCGKSSEVFNTYSEAEKHVKSKKSEWTMRIRNMKVVDYCEECWEIIRG